MPVLHWSASLLYRASAQQAQLPALASRLERLIPRYFALPEGEGGLSASSRGIIFSAWAGKWVRIAAAGIAWQRLYCAPDAAEQANHDWKQLVEKSVCLSNRFSNFTNASFVCTSNPRSDSGWASAVFSTTAPRHPKVPITADNTQQFRDSTSPEGDLGSKPTPRNTFSPGHPDTQIQGPVKKVPLPAGIRFPLALGSFGFETKTPGVLLVPALALVWCQGAVWLLKVQNLTHLAAFSLPSQNPQTTTANPNQIRKATPAADHSVSSPGNQIGGPLVDLSVETRQLWQQVFNFPAKQALTVDAWGDAVKSAAAVISAQQVEKIVLARDRIVPVAPVTPEQISTQLAEDYSTCWTYAIGDLVGATPEMLAQIKQGDLLCRVLAGTCKPGGEAALSHDPKELAEHRIATQSAERILRQLFSNLRVCKSPFLLRLPNVTHLASDLSAKEVKLSALQVAAAIHPTAAVCGKPRDLALEFLRALEQLDRGRFAGPIGWLDADGNGEWGLALRCAQVDLRQPGRYRVLAGAGIMAGSQPAKEIAETAAKMQPLLRTLQVSD